MDSARAYIGSFTSAGGAGILTARLDPESGALTVVGSTDVLADPSYLALAPDGAVLYAVSETEAGAAAAFDVRGDRPRLLAPPVPVDGAAPTHLALAGNHLLTANYGSGSVTWLPLDDRGAPGQGGVLRHQGSGPHSERQQGPHAHQVRPDPSGRWVLSVDLGTDSVRIHAADGGPSAPHREVALRPGSGPRHLAFHPRGDRAYVIHELTPTLTVCRWDAGTGLLQPLGETSVLPDDGTTDDAYPSAVVVDPRGRFLWTAIRGRDVISVLALDADGSGVRLLTTVDSGGHWPRDLALHPSGRFLYAAHERSGDVTWFLVDPESGIPRRTGAIDAAAASCVVFA